jgi:hypothetical protein
LFSLLLLVFVDDFELRVDDITIAPAGTCSCIGTGSAASFRPGLRTSPGLGCLTS